MMLQDLRHTARRYFWAGLVVVLVAGCGSAGSSRTVGPSGSSASPAAASASPAGASMPAGSAPSATPASTSLIPDGTYVGDPIPASTIIAAINATHLSAADKAKMISDGFELDGTSKAVTMSFTFSGGQWTQSASVDGGPSQVGAEGSYAFPDDHTVVLQDPGGVTTYTVNWSGAALTLKLRSDSSWAGRWPTTSAPPSSSVPRPSIGSPEMRRTWDLLLICCVFCLVCGCAQTPTVSPTASPTHPAASLEGPAESSPAQFTPSYADAPCPADVATAIVLQANCGYLTVLEDRALPAGPTIQLFVVRIDPPGGTTTLDPLLELDSLANPPGYAEMSNAGQRTHRVEYLLDPRGIGHSRPSLDCPEVVAAARTLVGLPARDPSRRASMLAAVQACHDRLSSEGVDVAAFDLAANAADIEDLRTTLGIPSWNLMSTGSDSLLVFEVMRRYPSGVRSAVIDSPHLPSPDLLEVGAQALAGSISVVATMCNADPRCSDQFPDPGAMIDRALALLAKAPIRLDVSGTVRAIQLGHAIPLSVDDAAFLRWVRWKLGTAGGSQAGQVLSAARDVLGGQVTSAGPMAVDLASDTGDCLGEVADCKNVSLGALYSIICRDEVPALRQSILFGAEALGPAYAIDFRTGALDAVCQAWTDIASPPGGGTSITGYIPTLVMRGTLDPYSASLADVRTVAGGNPMLWTLAIPNQSYNILGYDDCPRAIRSAWIDNPTDPPADTTCLNRIPKITLVGP